MLTDTAQCKVRAIEKTLCGCVLLCVPLCVCVCMHVYLYVYCVVLLCPPNGSRLLGCVP